MRKDHLMLKLTPEMVSWVLDAEANGTQDPTMKFEIEFDIPNISTAERLYDLALEAA